jgi:hypothetical protein
MPGTGMPGKSLKKKSLVRQSYETKFITGQNEREETTQDAIVTKSAAFASYEINYLTYITASSVACPVVCQTFVPL